ncbi:diguanylate cyclase [Alteromonas sp. ASW11-36]|uniref:diguanylate cyclase n=1 Tax=Alteromonas arenosi TaxID=3055817 RepID=A0ABT7T011_9ALTE|nr:diguanylate cyclase [Alteromonas sp. ASW11-36]MDM7861768.1 diguanylate cyclase [Alteromonas sp. ASW11-36]
MFRRFYFPFVLFHVVAFLFSATLAVYTYSTLKGKDALQVERALDRKLGQLLDEISNELQNQVDKLRSISSYVALTDEVTPSGFDDYAKEFSQAGDSWLLVEWQPIVKSVNRTEFEESIRQRYLQDFRLWEPDSDGNPIAAQHRPEHVPVLFVSTQTDANDTRGLDLAWSQERMKSKYIARDTGNAQLSGFFPIVLAPDTEALPIGFAITLPVYANGVVPKTLSARNAQIKGYIAGVFSIEDTMRRYFNLLTRRGVEIYLQDTEQNIIWVDSQSVRLTSSDVPRSSTTGAISAIGQKWTISLVPSEDYLTRNTSLNPLVFASAIIVIWIVLALLVTWIYRINRQLFYAKDRLEDALQKVKSSEKHYARLSKHDSLTGLLNRRAFFDILDKEIARSRRFNDSLCLLVADLDDFKRINDTYGHITGDLVLKQFADTCVHCCREQDVICRYGGEEFAVLMLNTSIEEGEMIARRLLQEVNNLQTEVVGSKHLVNVTFSGGLTVLKAEDDMESLMARGDHALYESKHLGRNRITVE